VSKSVFLNFKLGTKLEMNRHAGSGGADENTSELKGELMMINKSLNWIAVRTLRFVLTKVLFLGVCVPTAASECADVLLYQLSFGAGRPVNTPSPLVHRDSCGGRQRAAMHSGFSDALDAQCAQWMT
jgi:hypothetical protein